MCVCMYVEEEFLTALVCICAGRLPCEDGKNVVQHSLLENP